VSGTPPKPDFSGTWRFNPEKSALQIPAPDATIFVIEHREPLLHITRTHVVAGKSDATSWSLTPRSLAAGRRGRMSSGTHSRRTGSFVAEERFRSRDLSYDNRWLMERAAP
jgi:hypothetical protein